MNIEESEKLVVATPDLELAAPVMRLPSKCMSLRLFAIFRKLSQNAEYVQAAVPWRPVFSTQVPLLTYWRTIGAHLSFWAE